LGSRAKRSYWPELLQDEVAEQKLAANAESDPFAAPGCLISLRIYHARRCRNDLDEKQKREDPDLTVGNAIFVAGGG